MVFERFTDRASLVAIAAQEEARKMGSPAIGSEHYLLGLFALDKNPVVEALRSSGLTVDSVRNSVEKLFGQPVQDRTGHVPYTREAKRMLDCAKTETLLLDMSYITPGHLLLAMLHQKECHAYQVFLRHSRPGRLEAFYERIADITRVHPT